MTVSRHRLSLAILLLSGATMIAMSGARLVADASFWSDEAAIAYNVISMRPVELLGALDTGHQFPRLYLSAINQLRFVFGYETMVMRALPFAFFVAGVVLWHRLLWLRFRARPALLVLAAAVTLIPGDWFAYGAMFKQYSLDVFVALLPFTIDDAELDRRWRGGEGTWRLLLWTLPCLVSLSYGIALLGRWVGYAIGTWRARGGPPPLPSTGVLAAGFFGAMALSFLVDLRHAFENDIAFGFWERRGCLASGDPVADCALLGRWLVDWYVGRNPFGGKLPVHVAVVGVLTLAAAAGAVRLLAEAWRPAPASTASSGATDTASTDRAAWGTRALAALVTIGGLFAAALLLAYPLCANRLTLFAFLSLVLVTLEGFAWAEQAGSRLRPGPWFAIVPLAVAAAVSPSSWSTVSALLTRDAPENVRALLPIIATVPERPIVVGYCSGVQALTLPEWLDRRDVIYAHERIALGVPALPPGEEVWLVTTGGDAFCRKWVKEIREDAERFRPASPQDGTAMLFFVRMPDRTGS